MPNISSHPTTSRSSAAPENARKQRTWLGESWPLRLQALHGRLESSWWAVGSFLRTSWATRGCCRRIYVLHRGYFSRTPGLVESDIPSHFRPQRSALFHSSGPFTTLLQPSLRGGQKAVHDCLTGGAGIAIIAVKTGQGSTLTACISGRPPRSSFVRRHNAGQGFSFPNPFSRCSLAGRRDNKDRVPPPYKTRCAPPFCPLLQLPSHARLEGHKER